MYDKGGIALDRVRETLSRRHRISHKGRQERMTQ